MPVALARRRLRRPVHHGQIVDHAALQAEAVKALGEHSRAEAARRLDVSAPAITHALNEDPATAKYASIRQRIIAEFTAFRVEEDTLFRIVEKGQAGDDA